MEQEEADEAHVAGQSLDNGPWQLGSSGGDTTDVKVVVRVRPEVLSIEKQPGAHTCVEAEGFNSLSVRTSTETHSMGFNWVAGPATTQGEFFKVVGRPTVENCLSGFNSCIFAYGQTGSGKTHTMIGELPEEATDMLQQNAGLIPRIFQYLWRRMPEVQASMLEHTANNMAVAAAAAAAAAAAGAESQASCREADGSDNEARSSSSGGSCTAEPSLTWLVRCSMLEIHREEIYDLLRPNSGALNLREDIRKGVYVEGLVEKVVDNVQDALSVLRTGIALRQAAATAYNAASSRSHCIFTCHVESRLEPQPGLVNVRSSRLHMVDLAGSERLRYGEGGMGLGDGSDQLLKETTAINSSLSVLGLVILKLTESQAHIPYRNSKLTFLLQDSIGGNAKTIIIANISPSDACLQETLSTLKFATRARKLVNKAIINEDTNKDAAMLRAENKRLKQELALARELMVSGGPSPAAGQLAAEQLEVHQVQLQQALCLLTELGGRNSELEEALEYSRTERAELERRCLEDRQEIAALQVTLSQKEKEARSWRHKWFKLDKVAHSSRASSEPSLTPPGLSPENSGVHKDPAPIAAATAAGAAVAGQLQPGCSLTSASAQCASNGGSQQGTEHATTAAVAAETAEDEQHASEVLSLLGAHLLELVSSIYPQTSAPAAVEAAASSAEAPGQAVGATSAELWNGGEARLCESLNELVAVCQPRLSRVPELGSILSSLEQLKGWKRQLGSPLPAGNADAERQLTGSEQVLAAQQPASTEAGSDASISAAAKEASLPAAESSVGRLQEAWLVPSELHRQLEEERQLTAQLQEQVRQLQQQLVLAAEKTSSFLGAKRESSSNIGISCSAPGSLGDASTQSPLQTDLGMSTDSVLRGSTVAMPQPGPAEPAEMPEVQQPPVVVRLRIELNETVEAAASSSTNSVAAGAVHAATATSGGSSSSSDAANARVAELQQQLAALQEQLEVVTREKVSLQGRMATARTALAAARCSTPSSLNSSRLPSPQPCFSPLRPLYGESIDEEVEVEESITDVPAPGSWRRSSRCTGPGSPSTPVKQLAPASSPDIAQQEGAADGSEEEGLSHDEIWQQHHREWQQHQQQMEKRHQLTRAVHAAMKGVAGQQQQGTQRPFRSLSPTGKPPLSPAQPGLAPGRSSAELAAANGDQAGGLTARQSGPSNRCSLEELQQQQTPPRLQLPQQWGTDFRASGGGLAQFLRSCRLQIQQLMSEADGNAQAQHDQEHTPSNSFTAIAAGTVAKEQVLAAAVGGDASTAQSLCVASPANSVRSSNMVVSPVAAAAGSPVAAAPGDGATVATSAAATTGVLDGAEEVITGLRQPLEEEPKQQQQQQQQNEGHALDGPAWGMADYEEEFRQLRQQLEELVAANSSLKAALQQRDHALADKEALLEQQGHDLACSESLLQEMHERLATREREHCDAMWAKGQVAGLLELNEHLQLQLEQQGQELQELKAALERFMSSEAAPAVVAEAYAAASAALEQEETPAADGISGNSSTDQDDGHSSSNLADSAAVGMETEHQGDSHQALTTAGAAEEQQPQAADIAASATDQQQTAAKGAAAAAAPAGQAAAGEGAVEGRDAAGAMQLLASLDPLCDAAADTAADLDDQASVAVVVAAAETPAVATAAAYSAATPAEAASAQEQQQPQQQATGVPPAASVVPHSPSVARKLRLQTSQLSAQPSNLEIAAEQAILLRHQLEAVGLQLQQKQLEAKLAQVRMQMDRLQQHQKVQLQQQHLQLQRYQRHSAQLQQEVLNQSTPRKQTLRSGGIGGDGCCYSTGLRAATTGARLRAGQYSMWSPARSPVGAFPSVLMSPVGTAASGATSTAIKPAGTATAASAATPQAEHRPDAEEPAGVTTVAGAALDKQAAAARTDCNPNQPVEATTTATAAPAKQQADDADDNEQPAAADSDSTSVAATVDALHHGQPGSDGPAGPQSLAAAAAAAACDQQSGAAAGSKPAAAPVAARGHEEDDLHSSCSSQSSRCSDGSDSSSLGQCQDMLSDLLAQLHALAQESHDASTFKAASASTLTPCHGRAAEASVSKAYWPGAAAVQMQTKLQVSSALHLEATRGLMHAGTAVLELQNELSTAQKQQQYTHRHKQQQQQQDASPPLARSLLTKFDGAGMKPAPTVVDAAAAASGAEQQLPAADGANGTGESVAAAAAEQQQKEWLHVLESLAQRQQQILQQLATPPAAALETEGPDLAPISAKHQIKLAAAQLAELQQVQQTLLTQLVEAKAVLVQGKTHSPPDVRLSDLGTALTQGSLQVVEPDDGLDTTCTVAGAVSDPCAAATAAAAAGMGAAGMGAAGSGSRSPSKRQQRSKQRELLKLSQEGLLQQQQQQQQAAGSRSDQHQLRDSYKEGRMQQMLRNAKASGLLDGAAPTSSWDASCQTDERELLPAGTAVDDARSKGRASPAVQLRVEVPSNNAAPAQEESPVVVELRGEVAKLQLQVHDLKVRAQVAEDLRHKVLQHLPRSHSSCSSRGETELNGGADSTDGNLVRSSADAALVGGGSAMQRPPLLPPNLFSPRSAGMGALSSTTDSLRGSGSFGSGGQSSPGSGTVAARTAAAAAAAAGTPHAVFTLTGQNQYLQNRCLALAREVSQLKDLLQRLELQLKQQHLPSAAFSGAGMATAAAGGSSTARGGGSGFFSPRVGGAQGSSGGATSMFSPRLAGLQGTGPVLFSPRLISTPANSAAASPAAGADGTSGCGGITAGYNNAAAGGSPTKSAKSPLGTGFLRPAVGSSEDSKLGGGGDAAGALSLTGWLSRQQLLDAVPENSTIQGKGSRRLSTGQLVQQQQPCGDSVNGSSRRLAVSGGGSKGLKVAAPAGGRLKLAAMSRAYQQRRQSLG